MKFTTPCFVRVEYAEKRKELIHWAYDIGYTTYYIPNTKFCLISARNDVATNAVSNSKGFDCGTNIELFKALAAMTPYNDREQWFTDGQDWRLCHDNVNAKLVIPGYYLHKASAKEILKHFMK